MKLKYIVFYFIAGWLMVLLASTVIENYCIGLAAKSVNDTVALAADMAIQAVQSSDEFFKGSGINQTLGDDATRKNGIGAYIIYTPYKDTTGKTAGFKRSNLFAEVAEKVWDVDLGNAIIMSGNNNNTAIKLDDASSVEFIYAYMYGVGDGTGYDGTKVTTSFQDYIKYVGNWQNNKTHIPLSQIMYIDGTNGKYELKYGVIPTLLRMGADLITLNMTETMDKLKVNVIMEVNTDITLDTIYDSTTSASNIGVSGGVTKLTTAMHDIKDKNSKYYKIARANGFASYRKVGSAISDAVYYTTPLSLGLTYLDNDLLSYCFVNNMDLLMRSKYIVGTEVVHDSDTNVDIIDKLKLNQGITGDGPDMGIGLNQYFDNTRDIIDDYNIVNNGIFAFVKGENTANGAFKPSFDGSTTSTTVEYIIVDMFNADNDPDVEEILKQVFGAYTGGKSCVSEYLQSITTNRDLVDETHQPEHCYIVVAKCDFYADVIAPYFTPVYREFAAFYDAEDGEGGTRDNGSLAKRSNGAYTGALADNNFINMAYAINGSEATERVSTVTGNTMYHYTTYFAVAP